MAFARERGREAVPRFVQPKEEEMERVTPDESRIDEQQQPQPGEGPPPGEGPGEPPGEPPDTSPEDPAEGGDEAPTG
jgi:hypothetical protein